MNDKTQHIETQKEFGASKDKLYTAWTDEAALKQWWKPMNKQLVKVENDIREGGKVTYTFENDLVISGEYKVAKPGQQLSYTWVWNMPDNSEHKGDYLLTVDFSGDDSKSTLHVKQEALDNEEPVQPHQEGWENALEDLKNYLAGA